MKLPTVWGQYPNTILTFRLNGYLRVDLRQSVSARIGNALGALGLGGAFGVVTACNPMGIEQGPEVNRIRTDMLQMEVERIDAPRASVDACSADGTHCEASFAIGADQTFVTALAIRYDQLGIFWFDGNAFWIIPARSSNARLRLPVRRS